MTKKKIASVFDFEEETLYRVTVGRVVKLGNILARPIHTYDVKGKIATAAGDAIATFEKL